MKKAAFALVIALLVVTTIAGLGFFIRDSFFYNLEDIPEGKFLYSSMSPDPYQTFTVQFYVISEEDGPADGVRAVCINNVTREERTIYWQTGVTNAMVTWDSNFVININGISIDVTKEEYDWRFPKVVEI